MPKAIIDQNLQDIIKGQKFRVVLADPPWRYNQTNVIGAAEKHYETMNVEEIASLPVEPLMMKDSAIFLWTTNSFLPFSFHIVESWGFDYKTMVTWVKTPLSGMGAYFRNVTEHCLFGLRGHPKMIDRSFKTYLQEKRGLHSQKPYDMYKIIESCFFLHIWSYLGGYSVKIGP